MTVRASVLLTECQPGIRLIGLSVALSDVVAYFYSSRLEALVTTPGTTHQQSRPPLGQREAQPAQRYLGTEQAGLQTAEDTHT